jgi:hypothetical protein
LFSFSQVVEVSLCNFPLLLGEDYGGDPNLLNYAYESANKLAGLVLEILCVVLEKVCTPI